MSCQIWHSLLELLNLQAKATMFLTEIKITADFSQEEAITFILTYRKAKMLWWKFPVSYTHLDVYKRQILPFTIWGIAGTSQTARIRNHNQKNLSKIERNEVKQYGNEICRARYGTVFWNS